MSDIPAPEIDVREKLAHIDQMLADHDRKRQEISLAPWQLVMTALVGGLGAGAALFAAALAFFKTMGM